MTRRRQRQRRRHAHRTTLLPSSQSPPRSPPARLPRNRRRRPMLVNPTSGARGGFGVPPRCPVPASLHGFRLPRRSRGAIPKTPPNPYLVFFSLIYPGRRVGRWGFCFEYYRSRCGGANPRGFWAAISRWCRFGTTTGGISGRASRIYILCLLILISSGLQF